LESRQIKKSEPGTKDEQMEMRSAAPLKLKEPETAPV
jgi:hypothetical protein